ncbi:MAG TPA: hypothetical protein VF489_10755 [Sphingobium sp.]
MRGGQLLAWKEGIVRHAAALPWKTVEENRLLPERRYPGQWRGATHY